MPRLLLGVSGGIAAYKALELVRLATAAGHAVRVIQTEQSQRFVGAASFAALTGAPVLTDEFERDPLRGSFPGDPLPDHDPAGHLALTAAADLFVIAPASANTLAKLAAGLADNLLTSCALAADCPLVIAPAMNARMYEHPATQANLELLRTRGAHLIEPDSGRLASAGEHGIGRLAEPARVLAVCEELLAGGAQHAAEGNGQAHPTPAQPARSPLDGLRVLITAGGTREPIDSVRYIGNRSSGRMGIALAQAARERGAEVVLLSANVTLPVPEQLRRVEVSSAQELERACEQEFPACDVLLMAAAVADFTPAARANGKIKKESRERLELVLEPTADVLAGLAAGRRPGQTLVGFAAEHGPDAVALARGKLAAKGVDALVVNDISRADIGFDADANEVTILTAEGGPPQASAGRQAPPADPPIAELHVARAGKSAVAEAILDAVERLREGR